MTEPKRYRTKPIEIDALEWEGTDERFLELRKWTGNQVTIALDSTDDLVINTLEGIMRASKGDMIIKGTEGEFYPCKPKQFGDKYQEVTE